MDSISTVVFFDIETTGLPYQERNRTKIIELSFVAATRRDIMRNDGSMFPPVSKLTLVLNPKKSIHSAEITGLTTDIVKYSPTFKEKFNTIKTFLEDLSKPVCLVAHNGNAFDYKILLAECVDANVKLPEDLLCSDSMPFFRMLFQKNSNILQQQMSLPMSLLPQSPEITDDEAEDWPELNVSREEFQEIDDLCSSMSGILTGDTKLCNVPKKRAKKAENKAKMSPVSYKLVDIFKKLLGREPQNAHRAEDDCIMLLQCVSVSKNFFDASDGFLNWLDNNCKRLNEVSPLIRK